MYSKWIAGLLALTALAGCSVKENRTLCPCVLKIDLHHLPGPVSVQVAAGEYRATYTAGKDTVMVVQVPKGKIRLTAICGARLEEDQNMEIPYGFECPPVYLYSDLVNTLCDSTSVLNTSIIGIPVRIIFRGITRFAGFTDGPPMRASPCAFPASLRMKSCGWMSRCRTAWYAPLPSEAICCRQGTTGPPPTWRIYPFTCSCPSPSSCFPRTSGRMRFSSL